MAAPLERWNVGNEESSQAELALRRHPYFPRQIGPERTLIDDQFIGEARQVEPTGGHDFRKQLYCS